MMRKTGLLASMVGWALCVGGIPCPAAGADPGSQLEACDVFLVIQNTANMTKADAGVLIREGVTGFIRGLGPGSRVGIVGFADHAELLMPLTSAPMRGKSLEQALMRLTFGGQRTWLADGVVKGIYEFYMRSTEGTPRLLVVLSDGVIDTGDVGENAKQAARLRNFVVQQTQSRGIRVFSVLLGAASKADLLETAVSKTGGASYRVSNGEELGRAFQAILDSIPRVPSAPAPTGDSGVKTPLVSVTKKEPVPPVTGPAPKEVRTDSGSVKPPIETKATAPVARPPQEVAKSREPATPKVSEVPETGPAVSDRRTVVVALLVLLIVAIGLAALVVFRVGLRRREVSAAAEDAAEDIPEAYLVDWQRPDVLRYRMTKTVTRIGWDEGNEIQISADRDPDHWVSGYHATLEYRDHWFFVVDQGSTNGTFLNGARERLPSHERIAVKNGDLVAIGSAALVLRLDVPGQPAHATQEYSADALFDSWDGRDPGEEEPGA